MLFRTLLRELYVQLLVGLAIFASLLVGLQVIKLCRMWITQSLTIDAFLNTIVLSTTTVFPLACMTSAVFATFSVIGKHVENKAFLGLLTCGIGARTLLPQILVGFALPLAVLSVFASTLAIPWTHSHLGPTLEAMFKKRIIGLIRPNQFIPLSSELTLWTAHTNSDTQTLKNIFLWNRTSPDELVTISAATGQLRSDDHLQAMNLTLENAHMQVFKPDKVVHVLTLDSVTLQQNLSHYFKPYNPPLAGYTHQRLITHMGQSLKNGGEQTYWKALIHLHNRFALPVSMIMFVLCAFVICIGAPRWISHLSPTLKSMGMLMVIWATHSITNGLVYRGLGLAWLMCWFVPAVCLVLACAMLYRKRAWW